MTPVHSSSLIAHFSGPQWYFRSKPNQPRVDPFHASERDRHHRTIGKSQDPWLSPPEELAWLAANSTLRKLEIGEVLTKKGAPVAGMFVVLAGRVAIFVDRGSGPTKMVEWREGEVTGLLPYSRLVSPPGDTIALEPLEILALPHDRIQAMTRECFQITSILVHSMVDRARLFTSSDLHNEKLISLGKLSAGLAHELNNPASAVERGAALLEQQLENAEQATQALGEAKLSDHQLAAVSSIRASCLAQQHHGVRSPVEQASREEAIADWLADHGLDTDSSEALADTAVTFEALDQLAKAVDGPALGAVLRWAAAGCAVRTLASEIQDAAMRISGLVTAIKGFTNMDKAMVAEPVDLTPSLGNTVTVLKSKARTKSVTVALELEPGLPRVRGFAGELSQMWGNLIDNALDAVPQGGRVEVLANRENNRVVVRIVDNGAGIPPSVLERIFDPFFSTKPMGQGMGLGLDIVRRLAVHNDSTIEVESQPNRTEFRVSLPIAESERPGVAQ